MFVLLVVGLLASLAAAQPHHPGHEVMCYDCPGHGPGHSFPDCLDHSKVCHHEEVCGITYGGDHGPHTRCQPSHDCHGGSADATSADCPAGGTKGHGGCQVCCTDDSCVTSTMEKVVQLANVSLPAPGPHCPGECRIDDIDSCVSHGHKCHNNQYCKVTKDLHNSRVEARCEPTHDIQHCEHEVQDQHCDPHHHECTVGCCLDDQCVARQFGKEDSTTQAPTEAVQTTTAAGTDGGSSGFETLTCNDISSLNCSVLMALCPKIHCPSVCDPCMNPAGTDAPVVNPDTTQAPVVNTDMPPAGTDAPVVNTDAPVASTDMPQVVTDTMPPATSTAEDSSTCVDTIQNMSCSDVADVCSSPLLVSFCQKHCNLC